MKLVGVVGGSIGTEPFGRRTWSGICHCLFEQLDQHGLLERAYGASIHPGWKCALLVRNFHRDRRVWRRRFYMDPRFCAALTSAAAAGFRANDFKNAFFQIGAQLNLPRSLAGRAPCFSYHDGNVSEAMRAAQAARGISPRRIDAALAWERQVYRRMTRIFTMSEYLRRSFVRDFDIPEDRVIVVGAGINMEIPPANPSKRYDTEEILFIGVEFERKGGWQLLRAFEQVSARRPKARLHIVGPRSLSIPGNLAAKVTHHGYVDKSTPEGAAHLARLLDRCCLLALPSLYEPFGIAPLEAMAHEIPCIVTDGWALRETVTAGETGDLVALGSVTDLAEKLEAHLGNPERLRAWGQAGRARVLANFTWKSVARRIGDAVEAATSA